jgi:quercetin dioxygenase-like cupin family protein
MITTTVVLPHEAPVITAFGDTITLHLTGAQTGGAYVMFTSITHPGGGPPPHIHADQDEWFLVQEGAAEFFKDGKWHAVPAGGSVFVPRGTVHTFRNAGTGPLKQLIQLSPAGFETFFGRCAEEFSNPAGPDMKRVLEISADHGITFI